MKIELKKLKINLAFSEETTMFMADVYVDGVCVAYAQNDGHGGSTYYHAYEGKRELLKKAEEHCKAMPPIKYSTLTIDMNLEHFIDELVSAKANEKDLEKFKKKRDKAMVKHIVWGKPNSDSFNQWGFKGSIQEILSMGVQGVTAVENMYKKVKAELKEGEIIFNEDLVKRFGK
jgi:hypothetical protein